jgi:hypothetical protein
VATPAELLTTVREARSEAAAAMGECNEKWEVKPASGEGEEAWCSKEVAQHIIGADWFFTNAIAQACGAPAMERPQIDVSTPDAALASLRAIGAGDDTILNKLSQEDLDKMVETRALGTRSVAEVLQAMAGHCRDHVAQMRAANA